MLAVLLILKMPPVCTFSTKCKFAWETDEKGLWWKTRSIYLLGTLGFLELRYVIHYAFFERGVRYLVDLVGCATTAICVRDSRAK